MSARLDGRPLAVTRASVEALARELDARGVFRRVEPPGAEPRPGARVTIEEDYRWERQGVGGRERSRISGSLAIRVQAPGAGEPWLYESRAEARASHGPGRAGETREALIARVQQANLDAAVVRMRADPRLVVPARAKPGPSQRKRSENTALGGAGGAQCPPMSARSARVPLAARALRALAAPPDDAAPVR